MSILKVGDICIWQNQTGPLAYLNGTETTIIGELMPRVGFDHYGFRHLEVCYEVDTEVPFCTDRSCYAETWALRPKFPSASPEAEQAYLELIERIADRVMA